MSYFSHGHALEEGSEYPSDAVSRNSSNGGPSTHIPSGLRRPVSSSGSNHFSPVTAPPRTLPTPFCTPPSLPPTPLHRVVARYRRASLPATLIGLDQGRRSHPLPLFRAPTTPRIHAMQAQESTSRIDTSRVEDRSTNFTSAVRSPSSASPLSSPGASEEEEDDKGMALDEQEQEAEDEGDAGEQKASARGPNTSVNYKIKFQKAREKYTRIQADSASLLKGLQDAQKKEKKLEEEINWLLDTLASRRPDLANLEH